MSEPRILVVGSTMVDLIAYANSGADAVLVGESLVTGADPRRGVRRRHRRL